MTINPNNYPGSNVTIVGTATAPKVKTFENGGSQTELNVAVNKGYKARTGPNAGEWVDTGTDWYTLVATEDYAAQNWPTIGKGDRVRIDDARLEFRPYVKSDGEAGVEATLRFGTVIVVEAKGDRPARGGSDPAPQSDGGFASPF